MRPDHRAQLAAAIARFQADIRRLVQTVRPEERERLLATLDPARARPKTATAGTRASTEATPRRQPATPARGTTARTRARPAAPRRRRPPEAATTTRGTPAPAEPASATPASTMPAGLEASAATHVQTELPLAAAAGSAASAPAPAGSAAPAATTPAPAPAGSATGRRKRMQWTREAIVDELARWILSGTAIDASFVTRHGPPGLVPAARRVFGRFDAALNVAGLHVAKLYPDGPPGR